MPQINMTDREKALVRAANHLIRTYNGADGNDTDEQIEDAFDTLGGALHPYVLEESGLSQAHTAEINPKLSNKMLTFLARQAQVDRRTILRSMVRPRGNTGICRHRIEGSPSNAPGT